MAFNEYLTPIIHDNYSIRLLKNEKELREFQDLRYRHLILEFDPSKAETDGEDTTDDNMGYDEDNVQICAFYRDPDTGKETIVGGYIAMRFKKEDDFCKATLKYDLNKLFKYKFKVLEITRGVVHPDHRHGIVTKLLWDAIDAYMFQFGLRFIIGTMSFPGTDPLIYSQAASYLHYNYRLPEEIMVHPLEAGAYYHEYLKKEDVCRKTALRQIPPLLRGLMMIGARTCDGFYIDHDLGVVETLAVLDFENNYNLSNFGKLHLI
jgi:putative hemolysin